eukprot:364346-Chlamydomonas_euryale.AAC.5
MVVRQSKDTVLGAEASPPAVHAPPPKRVMVCTDDSPHAKKALQWYLDCLVMPNDHLHLVSVALLPPALVSMRCAPGRVRGLLSRGAAYREVPGVGTGHARAESQSIMDVHMGRCKGGLRCCGVLRGFARCCEVLHPAHTHAACAQPDIGTCARPGAAAGHLIACAEPMAQSWRPRIRAELKAHCLHTREPESGSRSESESESESGSGSGSESESGSGSESESESESGSGSESHGFWSLVPTRNLPRGWPALVPASPPLLAHPLFLHWYPAFPQGTQ